MFRALKRTCGASLLLGLLPSLHAGQLPGTAVRFEPAVGVSVVQDDNVFFREEDKIADSSVIINPQLNISSDLGIAGDSLEVDMDFRRESYSSESNLDNDEYRVAFEGVKMITRAQYLELTVAAEESVLTRNAADSFGKLPDTLEQREMMLGYHYKAGSIPLALTFGRASWRYVRLGSELHNPTDLRDRDETLATLRIGYAPNEGRGIYFQVERGEITGKADSTELEDRDGETMDWRLGYRFKTPGFIDLEANLGMHSLQYDDAKLADVEEFVHLLRVAFSLSSLTRLTFNSSNQVEMTRLAGSPGYQSLNNTLALEHDFGRRLRLRVQLAKGTDTFLDSEVEDKTSEQGVSIRYLLGRRFSLFASAVQETRRRNRVSVDTFDESEVERGVISAGIRYGL